MVTKVLSPLGMITLIGAVLAILAATTVPSMANARPAPTHTYQVGSPLPGGRFLYAAFDSGHPLPCHYFRSYAKADGRIPHINIYIKNKKGDNTSNKLARNYVPPLLNLHISLPSKRNGDVAIYAPKTAYVPQAICAKVGLSELVGNLKQLFRPPGVIPAEYWSETLAVLQKVMGDLGHKVVDAAVPIGITIGVVVIAAAIIIAAAAAGGAAAAVAVVAVIILLPIYILPCEYLNKFGLPSFNCNGIGEI